MSHKQDKQAEISTAWPNSAWPMPIVVGRDVKEGVRMALPPHNGPGSFVKRDMSVPLPVKEEEKLRPPGNVVLF